MNRDLDFDHEIRNNSRDLQFNSIPVVVNCMMKAKNDRDLYLNRDFWDEYRVAVGDKRECSETDLMLLNK